VQTIIITGNLGKDPEQRSTQGGDSVTSFSVGVRQGWGDRASTNWFRCSVWGKRGDTIREHLRKGMKATVVGELTIGEYQGKPQYDVRVNDVDWQPAGERQGGAEGGRGAGRAPADRGRGGGGMQGGGFGDDLDDDVPFVSGSFVAGLRVS
jgi:single-strand DNA-binding protein